MYTSLSLWLNSLNIATDVGVNTSKKVIDDLGIPDNDQIFYCENKQIHLC